MFATRMYLEYLMPLSFESVGTKLSICSCLCISKTILLAQNAQVQMMSCVGIFGEYGV